MQALVDFNEILKMSLPDTNTSRGTSRDSATRCVVLFLSRDDLPRVTLCMLKDDVTDFVTLVEGYYRVYVEKNGTLLKDEKRQQKTVNGIVNSGKLLCFTRSSNCLIFWHFFFSSTFRHQRSAMP